MSDRYGVRKPLGASIIGQLVFHQLVVSRRTPWWQWTESLWQAGLAWGKHRSWVVSMHVNHHAMLAPLGDYWVNEWIQDAHRIHPISQMSTVLLSECPDLRVIELGSGVGFWAMVCPLPQVPILGIEADFERFRLLNRNALYIDHFQTECAAIDTDSTTSAVSIDSDMNPLVRLSISELFHRHPSFQHANWLRIPLMDRVLESVDSLLGWAFVQQPMITLQWVKTPSHRIRDVLSNVMAAGYTRSLWISPSLMMGVELAHGSLIDDLIFSPQTRNGWLIHLFPPAFAHIPDLIRGQWRSSTL
ncbi:hypothetical protein EBZ35_04635 [bacterium]|nr:hypothetical protein [bacterium]